MKYIDFGKTGVKLSRLGMGCMRLPSYEIDGKTIYDEEKSVKLIKRAVQLGVNYFDTAPYYCDKQSEVILGKALKDENREALFISTKNPIENDSGDDYEKRLENSLKNLDMPYIDFYHFWGISLNSFLTKVMKKDGPFERAQKLKERGLIKHISFSFHDGDAGEKEPSNLIEILKRGEGILESVLCQYNLLDRKHKPGLEKAYEMGLGTVVMGPVGGGRLGSPSKAILDLLPGKFTSSAELAMRFVFSNPNINVALSGVSTIEQLEENAQISSNDAPLNDSELEKIAAMLGENKKLAELYCTGCKYCIPCPQGIDIPALFSYMNYHRVYQITDYARNCYAQIGKLPWTQFKNASVCTKCGICETKCPQSLPIRKQLEETHKALA